MSKGDVSLRKPGCAKMAAEKRALVSVSRVARAPSADDRATAEKYGVPMADSRDSADRALRSRRTMTDVCEIFGYRESQHFSRQLFVRIILAPPLSPT